MRSWPRVRGGDKRPRHLKGKACTRGCYGTPSVLSQESLTSRCGVCNCRPDGESLTANHHTRQSPDFATGDRCELQRLGAPIQGLAGLGSPDPDHAGQCRRSQWHGLGCGTRHHLGDRRQVAQALSRRGLGRPAGRAQSVSPVPERGRRRRTRGGRNAGVAAATNYALEYALDGRKMRLEFGHCRTYLAGRRAQAPPARNVQVVQGSVVRGPRARHRGAEVASPGASRGATRRREGGDPR